MTANHSISFDEPKTNRSKCWYCQALILKDDIRVNYFFRYRVERFHLLCFKPRFKEPIEERTCSKKFDKPTMEVVKTWIADWNSQFKSRNSIDVRLKVHKMHLGVRKVNRVRMWLEVLKWLPGIEVIKSISRVSRMFYSLSWNQEIFKYFCLVEFNSKQAFKCYRSLYSEIYKEACYICKSVNPDKKYKRYYHTNRNLCKSCDPNFVNKGDIKDNWKVNPNRLCLKYLRVKYCRKRVESHWINRSILSMRKKRKEKLFFACRRKKKFAGVFEKIKMIDNCELNNLEKDEILLKQLSGESEDLELLLAALWFIYEVKEKYSLEKFFKKFCKEN